MKKFNLHKILEALSVLLAVVLLYTFFYVAHIGCPIKFVTGFSCAGCGMTRAWFYLLRGDVAKAFYYHPLFFMPAIMFFVFVFRERINPKLYKIIWTMAVVIFLGVYFLRMFNPEDAVVVFQPKEGAIYKAFKFIRALL